MAYRLSYLDRCIVWQSVALMIGKRAILLGIDNEVYDDTKMKTGEKKDWRKEGRKTVLLKTKS